MNIAINGFGRIGRAAFKMLLDKKAKVVAINDLTDVKTLAHLLKYDSMYGQSERKINFDKDCLIVDGKKYPVIAEKDPVNLPWKDKKVDVVLECTGRFRTMEAASAHIKAGAKKVIISAPSGSDDVKTIVLSVNENELSKDDKIISMASCTTNCLAPVMDIIRNSFGIKKAFMTTIHSYTADQNLVDGPHKDLRRARTAGVNIIPTTTGAAKAVGVTIPELDGVFDGMALRVPTAVSSLCDIVILLGKETDQEKVNEIFKSAVKSSKYKNILDATEEQLVSSDFIGNPHSSIVDLSLTKLIGGDFLKVVAWYDNEWGYSSRLVDLCQFIEKKKLI